MTKNFPLVFDNLKFLFYRNESFVTLQWREIIHFLNVTKVNI